MLSLATSGRHSYLLLKGAEPAAVTLRSKSSDTHTVNIGAQNQRCDSKKMCGILDGKLKYTLWRRVRLTLKTKI